MKVAISVPDATFERAEAASRALGVSRSQFYAQAAERWLASLGEDATTDAIDAVLASTEQDTAFTDVAAAALSTE